MKKILNLFFIFSATAAAPLATIACYQSSLKDDNLKIVYENKEKNYLISDLITQNLKNKPLENFSLQNQKQKLLAENVFQKIIYSSKNIKNINWYNESSTNLSQKYYNYEITNGKNKNDNEKQWDVNAINQRFTINIKYFVGTIDNNKKFNATEKIDKVFNIKVADSKSDKIIKEWNKNFNKIATNWTSNSPLNITTNTIKVPEDQKSWDEIDKELKTKTYTQIKTSIKDDLNDNVAFSIFSEDKIQSGKISLKLKINLNESLAESNDFWILFKN